MTTNEDLINHLIETNAMHSQNIIDAFLNVDRANFVLDANDYAVYADHPLPIGHEQTISQPTTVAMMLEMLRPNEGQKVLDIGSGSGYTTALLAYIVGDKGSVTGLERVPYLVKYGNDNLKKYGWKNVKIIQSENGLGLEGEIFDRILVSAAANEFPLKLTQQLNIGGKLVIPVKNSIFEITKKEDGELQGVEHYGFTFVPLIF